MIKMPKKKKKLVVLDWISIVLLLIGGINWGLFGAFKLDLVKLVFGSLGWFMNIVYIVIGLSAIYVTYRWITQSFMK